MKHAFKFLVAPLRLVSRSVALVAAALLLLGAWSLTLFMQTAQVERDALSGLTVSASAVASAVDAPLEHFADMTNSFRASDFTSPDPAALTARLVQLQNAMPPVGATFMVDSSGRLLASSTAVSPADTDVADTSWFRGAVADNAMLLGLHRDDTWLHAGPAAVLTRVVRNGAGKTVGLIGAVLQVGDLTRLVGHTWLAPGVSIEFRGVGGTAILATKDNEPSHAASAHVGKFNWGTWLMSGVNRMLGVPKQLTVAAPLRTVDATVVAGMDSDIALSSHWLGTRAIGILGAYLLAVWVTCLALAVSVQPKAEQTVLTPAGFGADWQLELDKRGIVVAAFGYTPDRLRESAGMSLLTALGLTGTDGTGQSIAEALEARARIDGIQVPIPNEDGQERFHRLSIEPEPDGRFVCTGRDVTTEVRALAKADAASAACQTAQDEAATVAGDRDRVLAALGHDVRTPMNSIMGICSLLLDSELEREQRTWLERIRASCDALLAMLNGLLEIASGEVGGAGLQADEVDVIGLVQEVAGALQPQARDKGLELRTRYDDLLRGQWLIDTTRLRQVLFNLIGNAVKYTVSGHVEIRASAFADAAGQTTIKLSVLDTGPGIAPEDRTTIFERFKRGRAHVSAGHEGLGLGLALCRENAVLMGGTLTVESAVGVGSEFTFEFPAERVSHATRSPLFAGRTALLVADDDSKAGTIANQLGDIGLLVETAPDGYLGMALAERMEAQRGALDLVVLQGNLTGMRADAFVIRLRATPFGRRSIVIWLGDGGSAAEVDAIVPQPADPYQVISIAKQLLADRSPFEVLDPSATAARGGRVLVVEDDKVNQSLLLAALTRRGFAVFCASNGDEAVRLASRDSFDAILMDIQMPGRDGFETTRKIRELRGRVATIPIIALTGLQGPLVRKRCTEGGFTAMLEKPINLDRLGATLRRFIPGAGAAMPMAMSAASGLSTMEQIVGRAAPGTEDYTADVSQDFLEEMVTVVGMERARACVADFVADATARCMRLGELLPGWESGAIVRSCEEISGLAETCGAFGLGEVLEEIADAVTRNDRSRAETLVERLEAVTGRLGPAMAAYLDAIERRWSGRSTKAA